MSHVPHDQVASSIAALAVIDFELRKTSPEVERDLRAYLSEKAVTTEQLAYAVEMLSTWASVRVLPESTPPAARASRVAQLNARLAARELLSALLTERHRACSD